MSILIGSNQIAGVPTGVVQSISNLNEITANLSNNKADKLYQNIVDCTNGNIVLQDTSSVYNINVSSNTTFTFDTSNLTKTLDNFTTFELRVYMNPVVSLTFPASVRWINNESPDLSRAGTHFFTFRKIPDTWGSGIWYGCLEGYWA